MAKCKCEVKIQRGVVKSKIDDDQKVMQCKCCGRIHFEETD